MVTQWKDINNKKTHENRERVKRNYMPHNHNTKDNTVNMRQPNLKKSEWKRTKL